MRKVAMWFVALGAMCAVVALQPESARASGLCGNGNVDAMEECDGGSNLFIDGDPAQSPCEGGSRCYFQFTCCKFNCQFVGTPGAPCQDGDACNSPDTCDQVGVCHPGPPAENGMPCDDGLYCNGRETCQNGACTSAGDPCPGTACRNCNEADDDCLDPLDSPCSDGSVCVTGGACDGAGNCVGGVFNSGPCDDGLYCNGADTCSGGACVIHAGDPCPGADGDIDCVESCDETSDSCEAGDPDGSACDDGLYCTGDTDQCSKGICSATGTLACDDGNDCTTDSCDEALDACSTLGTLPDGTACEDGDLCTLGDVCTGGLCVGQDATLEDLCPWVLVHREQETKDQIRTRSRVGITGDVCGGILHLSGKPAISDDVVADEEESLPLQLAPEMIIGGEIVSSGGGARANPTIGYLPYTNREMETLPPGTLHAKSDGSGTYDLTGTHPLALACHAARTSYEAATAALDGLETTDVVAAIKLRAGEVGAVATLHAGGRNVIDVDGSVRVGKGATLILSGGGNPDTVVVLRIAGGLQLLASSTLELADALTPDHTLIYVRGKRCLLNYFSFGAGTLMCSPARFRAQGAAWVGAVFADGRRLYAKNESSVFYTPFTGF